MEGLLERLVRTVAPARDVLVVGSARGDVAFELARRLRGARVVGVELDPRMLAAARARARRLGLERWAEFLEGEDLHLPLPSGRFDVVVHDRCLFPSTTPPEFGAEEMLRMLKPGGRLVLVEESGAVAELPGTPALAASR